MKHLLVSFSFLMVCSLSAQTVQKNKTEGLDRV